MTAAMVVMREGRSLGGGVVLTRLRQEGNAMGGKCEASHLELGSDKESGRPESGCQDRG